MLRVFLLNARTRKFNRFFSLLPCCLYIVLTELPLVKKWNGVDVLNYTLGLDIGITSVGWCVLNWDKKKIEDLGVRCFPGAENAKDGASLALPRRMAAGALRRTRRKAARLLEIRQLIVTSGLLHEAVMQQLFLVSHQKTPYALRAEGLDRLLQAQEWARVLLHIAKHRGFKSNRKSEEAEDSSENKGGKLLGGIQSNKHLLEEKNYRTVGEMMEKDEKFSTHKRNKGSDYSHTISRNFLNDEVAQLFSAQRNLKNPHADPCFEETYRNIYLRQLPVASAEDIAQKVGYCSLEPEKKRAPKRSWTAERFRLLTQINHVRLEHDGKTYLLDPEQRRIIEKLAYEKSKLTYAQVRTGLGLDEAWQFGSLPRVKGDKDPESAVFTELKGFHSIRVVIEKSIGKEAWKAIKDSPSLLDTLVLGLTLQKSDENILAYLSENKVEEYIAQTVLPLSFSGFTHLSIEAMEKLIPFLEQGMRYDEAVKNAGYIQRGRDCSSGRSALLPVVDVQEIRNPVVIRSVTQTRKVVNAIIRKYGSPVEIHVELARELAKPREERNMIHKDQKENEEQWNALRADFHATFTRTPNGHDLLKYRLWKDQGGFCAYSGQYLDPEKTFGGSEGSYAEVDHIIPYSRCFNDGYANKVLVLGSENRNKGNRTPYEYLGLQEDCWASFVGRVETNIRHKKKKQLLLKKEIDEKTLAEMRDRNLTDTRYITRYVAQYLEQNLTFADPENKSPVRRLNGSVTALLRKRWGLVKNREESDLHHALDAAVIAAVTQWMVQEISTYTANNEMGKYHTDETKTYFPEPWSKFREELKARMSENPKEELQKLNLPAYSEDEINYVSPIFVSRKPDRKASGAGHQETIRSAKYLNERKTALRTSLENLKIADLENMVGKERDTRLYEALKQQLRLFGNDGKKAFKEPFYKPTKDGRRGPVVRTIKLFSSDGVSGIPVRGGIANNGGMVRVDVYQKGKKHYLVPVYVADIASKKTIYRAVVARKQEEQWDVVDSSYTFLFSLFKNDLVKLMDKDKSLFGYYISCNRNSGSIRIENHDGNLLMESAGVKTCQFVEKYTVDILGEYNKVEREKPPYELA